LFESLTYTIKQEQRFIFDIRPYGRYQNIRCINQSKIKKDYILKNITTQFTVKDSLIRLYDNTSKGIYKNINIEGLNNMEIIKHKKSKNKSKTEPKGETDNTNFQVEGMAILIKKEITFESLNKLPQYLQYLYLIPNTSQNVTIFTNIGMALKTCGGSIIDYVEFAKLSPKYGGSNSKIHYKFSKFRNKEETEKLNCRSYGLNYLKSLAKLANPEYFKSCNQCLMAYFSLNTENIKVIKETSQFVSQEGTTDENNILTESKFIVLHAYLGRGKTTAIKRILPSYQKVLFFSPRQTFARFLSAEFNIECYLDKNFEADKLIISVESLLNIPSNKTFDIIVLDECESILKQFSSPTTEGKHIIQFQRLMWLIANANKVIFADAFITNRTLDLCRSFHTEVVMKLHL
jgi:Origin of replication binding protein